MTFPNINYKFWLQNWNDSIGNDKVYSNKHMEHYIVFDGDINECTDEIIKLTETSKLDKKSILRVIDLIYSWGGKSVSQISIYICVLAIAPYSKYNHQNSQSPKAVDQHQKLQV